MPRTPIDPASLRNRIKDHRKVRLGDLVPHELNPRRHADVQSAALRQLYQEIGFARSVLAYELPDGRLKLIDGHLRRDLTPEAILDVEVLDVTEEEARVLLLAIDPLAQLATYDDEVLRNLRAQAEQDSAALQQLWRELEGPLPGGDETKTAEPLPEQYLILIECADEQEQVELLERFQREGLKCQAKMA